MSVLFSSALLPSTAKWDPILLTRFSQTLRRFIDSTMSPSEDEPSGESQRHSPFTDTNSSTDDTNDMDINNNHQKPKIETTAATTSSSVKIENEEAPKTPIETPSVKTVPKKSNKRRNNGFWNTTTSRKSKKKSKSGNGNSTNGNSEGNVLLTPIPRLLDRTDDTPEMSICLSKIYKAEGVELSEDRMSAGSIKGYRMVRATRGVTDGAWYFEIKMMFLGESGHTRLGWCMDKADLQGPVGYDMNSFGYRDIDGSKFHKAVREVYGGEGYKEGDVIGFYINLPNGMDYAPKEPQLVPYKGQKFLCHPDGKEEPPKIVPGSEISFFKNGVCQGVAFKDLSGGRYYPAASMYTLPAQPKCEVKFNFGPHFDFFPNDFFGRPIPKPMIEAPYHGFESQITEVISSEKQK